VDAHSPVMDLRFPEEIGTVLGFPEERSSTSGADVSIPCRLDTDLTLSVLSPLTVGRPGGRRDQQDGSLQEEQIGTTAEPTWTPPVVTRAPPPTLGGVSRAPRPARSLARAPTLGGSINTEPRRGGGYRWSAARAARTLRASGDRRHHGKTPSTQPRPGASQLNSRFLSSAPWRGIGGSRRW
jgi:hypothetical protein